MQIVEEKFLNELYLVVELPKVVLPRNIQLVKYFTSKRIEEIDDLVSSRIVEMFDQIMAPEQFENGGIV